MKTRVLCLLTALLISGTSFTSCQTGKSGEIDFELTKTGIGYYFHVQNEDSKAPAEGDILTLRLTYGTPDTVYYSSDMNPGGNMMLPMSKPQNEGDLFEALAMMHLGDSASFMVNAETFFLKTAGFPEIPAFAAGVEKLLFNVSLDKIQTEAEIQAEFEAEMLEAQADEDIKIQEYLTANNINSAPTESGMYYIEQVKGTGAAPEVGDKVKVHYTGTLLDGTKFDSSVDRGQPFEFTLGVGQVIKGWDEGIAMMNIGSKGKFVLPSRMAYGERGAGRDIPPYAPLVFEVELLDVIKQ
ncbi:MAG: FKBP-type peptidyl-prolyl cis-trans isomerase [Bacteroidales bacterium]|nr:FKBP-type peptidyl-prolyl cis-trans isomerase [Bacteroidales bacterium]